MSARLTPVGLSDEAAVFSVDDPLVNFRHLLEDQRFLGSLLTQAKLSLSGVTLQVAVGLGVALLLNGRSRLLAGVRTAFLVPMVLPPIGVALSWQSLYTPDLTPLHRAVEAPGRSGLSAIRHPPTPPLALTAR